MFATLFFNGIPTLTTIESSETYSPTSVQGQVKALTSFTNHVAGKATQQDVREAARAVRLTGNDR